MLTIRKVKKNTYFGTYDVIFYSMACNYFSFEGQIVLVVSDVGQRNLQIVQTWHMWLDLCHYKQRYSYHDPISSSSYIPQAIAHKNVVRNASISLPHFHMLHTL